MCIKLQLPTSYDGLYPLLTKYYYGLIVIGEATHQPFLCTNFRAILKKYNDINIRSVANQCLLQNAANGLWVLQVPTIVDITWKTLRLFEQPGAWPLFVLVPMECLDSLRKEILENLQENTRIVARGYYPHEEL